MTIATTLMGLLKAQGSDNARDYVKTALPATLDKLDAQNHDGGTGGAAVAKLALTQASTVTGVTVTGAGATFDNFSITNGTLNQPALSDATTPTTNTKLGYAGHLVNVGDGTTSRVLGTYLLGRIGGDGVITSFDFPNIPAWYESLELVIEGRVAAAVVTNILAWTFNGDTGTNYDHALTRIDGTGAVTAVANTGNTSANIGYLVGTSAPSVQMIGTLRLLIPGYARTVFQKSFQATGGVQSAAGNAGLTTWSAYGRWQNTGAISHINVATGGAAIATGSIASLYGIG